jgi:hypothetical protein
MRNGAGLEHISSVIREWAGHFEQRVGLIQEAAGLFDQLTTLIDAAVAQDIFDPDRREAIEQAVLALNVQMLRGVAELRKAQIDVAGLLMMPEFQPEQ